MFTVKYNAYTGGCISGHDSQTIKKGEDADLVIAIPDEGYIFVNWSDGNTEQIRQDKNVTKNINVTVYFDYVLADGKGTENNPFLIETYEQFLEY